MERTSGRRASSVVTGFCVGLLVMIGWPLAAAASGGSLDPTYGSGGQFFAGSNSGFGQAAALDGFGRLVIAGYGLDPNGVNDDFELMRVTPAGVLDSTFGTGGVVKTHFAGTSSFAQAVAVDSAGRIIAAGYTAAALNNTGDFAVARYNADGSLDATFGTGGMVVTDLGNNDEILAIAIDGVDRIVAAGYTYNGTSYDFAIARYATTGDLDTTFNGTGKVLTDFAGRGDEASAVTIDATGRIVAAGVSYTFADSMFALARYNPDGSLDTTFNGTGTVTTIFSDQSDWAHGVTIDAVGRIVAVGVTAGFNTGGDFAIARYNDNGSLDATFNGSGKVTTDFGGSQTAHAVAIDDAGRLVVAGATTPNDGSGRTMFAVARYEPTGALDGSFGTGGWVASQFPTASPNDYTGLAVAIDDLQRILVAGLDMHSDSFSAARYLSASADLTITKSASPDPVAAGQPLTYTIVVTNNGPDATLAELTDPLPAGVTYSSATATQGSCSVSSATVDCMLGSLANGAAVTVTITVQTTTAAVPSVTNTATVAGNDPDPANNSASVTSTVNPAADLSVSKVGTPNPVVGGSDITYTIVVTNNGPSPATGVALTDPLVDRYGSSSTTAGSCTLIKAKGSATLSCAIGTLNSGASATVTLVVKSPHKKGTTSNTASVTANEIDPDPSNNSATAVVTVQ